MSEEIKYFTLMCECDSYSCREKVTVPIEEAQTIKKYLNVVVIVIGEFALN